MRTRIDDGGEYDTTTIEAVPDQIWVRGEDDGGGFGSARRARTGEA